MAAPGRSPGWVYDDTVILAGQGKASSFIPRTIHASEAHMPGLGERLARPGARLLDIGSGVGELSIAACRVWPTIEVVGVDPWEPAMTLARRNVAAAGLADRIELRLGLVEELPDSDDFALVWLPGPFLPRAARPRVLEASFRLLEPSGWAVFGLYAGPPDSLAIALMNLRTLRSGGEPIAVEQAATELTSAGFVDVGVLPRTWEGPASYVVGRKP